MQIVFWSHPKLTESEILGMELRNLFILFKKYLFVCLRRILVEAWGIFHLCLEFEVFINLWI